MPEPYPNLLDHERRTKSLERRVAIIEERFREFVNAQRGDEERDSSADLSVHPGRLRVSLRNIPPWAVVAIALAIALVASIALR